MIIDTGATTFVADFDARGRSTALAELDIYTANTRTYLRWIKPSASEVTGSTQYNVFTWASQLIAAQTVALQVVWAPSVHVLQWKVFGTTTSSRNGSYTMTADKWHLIAVRITGHATNSTYTVYAMQEGDSAATTVMSGTITNPASVPTPNACALQERGSAKSFGISSGVVVRNHTVIADDVKALFDSGRYSSLIDYTGGNLNGPNGVRFAMGFGGLWSPAVVGTGSATPAVPGETPSGTNVLVWDEVAGSGAMNAVILTDASANASMNVTATGSAAYVDPQTETFFADNWNPGTAPSGLPVAGQSQALYGIYNDSVSVPTLAVAHTNSRGTSANADDMQPEGDTGTNFGDGLHTHLMQAAGRATRVTGSLSAPRTITGSALGLMVVDATFPSSGAVSRSGTAGITEDDWSKLGTGNNNAMANGPGTYIELDPGDYYEAYFDIQPGGLRGDIDPDTDDLTVVCMFPKTPNGGTGDVTLSSRRTSAKNTAGTQIAATNCGSASNTAGTATVVSHSGTSLVLSGTGLGITAGMLSTPTSGSASGAMSQGVSVSEGGGNTTVTLEQAMDANASASDTVAFGNIEWIVGTATIAAGTLSAGEYAGLRVAAGAGTGKTRLYVVGIFATTKAGTVVMPCGWSGNGFDTQRKCATADSGGYSPMQNFWRAIHGLFSSSVHMLGCASQGAESYLGTMTDDLQAAGLGAGSSIAWIMEGPFALASTNFLDSTLCTDWGDYCAANAAAQGVFAASAYGLVDGSSIDLLSRGLYWRDGASHFTSEGNRMQWDALMVAGQLGQVTPAVTAGSSLRGRGRARNRRRSA